MSLRRRLSAAEDVRGAGFWGKYNEGWEDGSVHPQHFLISPTIRIGETRALSLRVKRP